MLSLTIASLLLTADPSLAVRIRPTSDHQAIEVVGCDAAALRRLRESTAPADVFRVTLGVDTPPLLGTYTFTATGIRFEPRFPFVPGTTYAASFRHDSVSVGAAVTVPTSHEVTRTRIVGLFPSANQLPENTLRLYVHFSGPMNRKDIYRHLKLVRADGKGVELPFLELDEQLWSADGTRLTLLFDPGRVKRGLVPREQEGPILEEGRRYTLTIDQAWEDVHGRSLRETFRKGFVVGPPDETPVEPRNWSLMAPRKGLPTPLIIRLVKPLDRALLHRFVWVTDANGKKVDGVVTVGGGERVVTFATDKPWAAGTYHLVVDTRLEDVCGNRVGEAFEVDEFKPVEKKREKKTVSRTFVVR